MLRNGLLRYILHTCPNLAGCNPYSTCYGMDCFGTYFTHVQTGDATCVQSATEWNAAANILHIAYFTRAQTCDVTRVHCYGMDCFGAYFTHVQTCDVTRLQSATEWTASVHTERAASVHYILHTSPNFLRNGLLRYVTRVQSATEWTPSVHILHICPNL